MMADVDLPRQFCWTKYGSEAGESVRAILSRKERERRANGGLFLWGIGNSVAPGIRRLVSSEKNPRVVFSPMRSAPKAVDAKPDRVVEWTRATDLNGADWRIPDGSVVTSRANSSQRAKSAHYALVCWSDVPVDDCLTDAVVVFDTLRNLESGNALGFSQVTSVVQRLHGCGDATLKYPVGLVATLVFPYFVVLHEPVCGGTGRRWRVQQELAMAF